MVDALVIQRVCDGLIDIYPTALWIAGSGEFCSANLQVVGQPLDFGPQDFAVGIRQDLHVRACLLLDSPS
jgi:hypothetical protein